MWTSGWNVVYLWVTLFFLFLCVAMALVLLPPRFFLSFSLFELLSFPLPFPLRSLVRYFCVWPSYKLEKCPFKHDKVPFALSLNCLQRRRLFSLFDKNNTTNNWPLPSTPIFQRRQQKQHWIALHWIINQSPLFQLNISLYDFNFSCNWTVLDND